MNKIVVIQFRIDERKVSDEERAFLNVFQNSSVDISFKNATSDSLQWSDPLAVLEGADGVILGGSGDFDFDGGRAHTDEFRIASHQFLIKMKPLLEYISEQDFPTIGICFGHQILARSVGTPVVHDTLQAKEGRHEVSLTADAKNDFLFKDLPHCFPVHYGHKDSLATLPEGATLLAYGDKCSYSALRFGNNRYGFQFHPELEISDTKRVCAVEKNLSHRLSNIESNDERFIHAKKLLENFANK